ncbi:MAG: hypothetical protein JO339_18235 [Alphaproteobacteria bacterium]|nr:hypothetical protein [Alphaproteobacteria bacterium]
MTITSLRQPAPASIMAESKLPASAGRSLAEEVRELRALGTNRRMASLALFRKSARQLGPKGPGASTPRKRAA